MKKFWKLLHSRGVLIADGAWGTEMMKKGLHPGECPELWNINQPNDVSAIAKAYRDAGADIILTNTFGANIFKLKKSGAADKVSEINRRGIELSKAVCGDSLVFASIGPTGEFIKPLGAVTEKEMISAFKQQVDVFVEEQVDGIIIETMIDLNEAKCALSAVKEISDIVTAVSMTFEKGPRGFATIMGVTPAQAASELEREGADLAGSNCGSGIEDLAQIACEMHENTSLPLWIKPNAGAAGLKEGKTVYPDSPGHMSEFVAPLLECGVKVIGGCCGTTPEHIKLIRKTVGAGPCACP